MNDIDTGKCIYNNTQVFIKNKSHMTKIYVTLFHYLGFHYEGQGHFSMNKQNISNFGYNC